MNDDVRMNDVWRDKAGKHWRVITCSKDRIAIKRCNKKTGRLFGVNNKPLDVPRDQFFADYVYAAHASL